MGLFGKLMDAQKAHNEKYNNKNKDQADGYINTILTQTGFKRAGAKGKLFGSNKITKIMPQYNVDYVGGFFESPEGKEDVDIIVLPQGILINNIAVGDLIPIDDIKTVSMKTEEEIQKNVTLTRMLAFGIYSLALKKKKKVVRNFVLLSCERNGMEYSVVFGGNDATKLYGDLFKVLSESAQ